MLKVISYKSDIRHKQLIQPEVCRRLPPSSTSDDLHSTGKNSARYSDDAKYFCFNHVTHSRNLLTQNKSEKHVSVQQQKTALIIQLNTLTPDIKISLFITPLQRHHKAALSETIILDVLVMCSIIYSSNKSPVLLRPIKR